MQMSEHVECDKRANQRCFSLDGKQNKTGNLVPMKHTTQVIFL